jgi:uncharacterized protein related to proFAR isomerase
MVSVSIEFIDYRGQHVYNYDLDALPRVGETVEIKSELYQIVKVIHDTSTGHVTLHAKKRRR